MPIERFEIANFERWGNLVKTWSTGVNRLNDGNDYPVPTTLQQFKDQCVKAGVGATIPPYVAEVKFVQAGIPSQQLVNAPTIATLLFRLPPKELVEDSENMLNGGSKYNIPEFYNRIFNRPDGPVVPQADIMKLHAERIGEYTMNVCQ